MRRVFEKRLTTAFIDAYREPNMSLLADSLKGLASISLQKVAEETFATEIVRPYMEKVKSNNEYIEEIFLFISGSSSNVDGFEEFISSL